MNQLLRFSLAACSVLGACSALTEPTRPDVEFEVTAQQSAGEPPVTSTPYVANAAAGNGVLVVMGHFQTPTPCWDLSQIVERTGNALEITITATERSVPCAQVIAVREYTLRVNGLPKVTYALEVVHELLRLDGSRSRVVVVQKPIVVQ